MSNKLGMLLKRKTGKNWSPQGPKCTFCIYSQCRYLIANVFICIEIFFFCSCICGNTNHIATGNFDNGLITVTKIWR